MLRELKTCVTLCPRDRDPELETSVLIHTLEYYSAINRDKAVRHAAVVRSAYMMLKAGFVRMVSVIQARLKLRQGD